MKKYFSKLIVVVLFFTLSLDVFCQTIPIKTIHENITVQKDTSFIKNVSVFLKKSDEPIVYPIFYDTELEKIYDIKIFNKKGKRFKEVKDIISAEEDVTLDYIASKKVKSIFVPSDTEAKITYSIKCDELMYFSGLPFFSNNEIDTLKYQISVPNSFKFVYNTIHKDSLEFITIDSIKSSELTKWYISAKPVKVTPDPLMFFGIYKNTKGPFMRTLVAPSDYTGHERKYMNDWYLKRVEDKRGLNPAAIKKINELTEGMTDPMIITDVIYNYVQNNFKYVAIEIGMGAFIPSHANEVFSNKQGDCKDLSNFLSEALNYKGIKSQIALAATYDHISDCDFPSLSSANHVICLAYINEEPIMLDPTDPIHFLETPVQSLQKRTVLVINSNGGEFYKALNFSSQQNLINYEIKLNANNTLLKGGFNVNYNGISGNFLKHAFFYSSENEVKKEGKKHYESVFGNQSISDLKINYKNKIVTSEGNINVSGKILKDGDNRFLFVDFLPRIIETHERETLLEGMNLGNPFNKKVNLEITLDEPFQLFDPIEHKLRYNGVTLLLKISCLSEFIIQCKYDFVFDYIFIEKENLNNTNEVLKSFKKIINDPIVFKKKS